MNRISTRYFYKPLIKRYIAVFGVLILVYNHSTSQTLSPTVIAAAGDVYINSQGSLSVTIGEMTAIETFKNTNANLLINQGFQQTYENNTVPLKFIAFIAKRNAHNIPVSWRVGEMINVSSFDLERSWDGNNFSTIKNKTIGNTADYSFTDKHPQKAWYRVKVNEADGSFWYSWIESVPELPLTVQIYPNPTLESLHIQYNSSLAGTKNLRIIDIQGKIILAKNLETKVGFLNYSHFFPLRNEVLNFHQSSYF